MASSLWLSADQPSLRATPGSRARGEAIQRRLRPTILGIASPLRCSRWRPCKRSSRETHRVARIHVEDVAGALGREVGGEIIDRFGDVLGIDRAFQERPLAVDFFELRLGNLVRGGALGAPFPLPDLGA